MWDDGKGVCVGRALSVTFCSILFLYPCHTRRPITTVYGSKRVFPRKVGPFGGLDDKNNVWGSKLSKKHDLALAEHFALHDDDHDEFHTFYLITVF